VFWLNPQDPETFPSDLLEALTTDGNTSEPLGVDEPERLRQQMKADALQPLNTLEDEDTPTVTKADAWPPEVVEEARKFISANVCYPIFLFFDLNNLCRLQNGSKWYSNISAQTISIASGVEHNTMIQKIYRAAVLALQKKTTTRYVLCI